MTILRTRALAVGALCLGVLASGCAGAARPDLMTPAAGAVPAAAAGEPGHRAVRVGNVSGGGDTNPMWMSNVSAQEFKTALQSSLRAANYLSDAAPNAQYEVTAELINVERPMVGFDLTVNSTVAYSVKSVPGQQEVFRKTIASNGTARMSDALLGTERVRIAIENSIRENITKFIQELRTSLRGSAEE